MSQSGEQSVLERNLAALRRVGSGAERVLRQAAPLARQAAQFPRELPADIYCFILQGMQPPEMLHELLNREGRDRIFTAPSRFIQPLDKRE